ncbi:MAG: LysR family transcriptional regulator [Myxococcales bacterium]|nr:LysR family transcriptional regulator [Myxococcales bacterium]
MKPTDLRAIDLNLLVSLDALLQEESVTRAAERVGLSTPAMSHALARLRVQLGDPLLVRSGRAMVLSARGAELKGRVRTLVEALGEIMTPAEAPTLRALRRTYSIHASDYVLLVLGHPIDRRGRDEAPGVAMRFVPNGRDDAERLREGRADLVITVETSLPPELRTQKLFDERLVCVVRREHPVVKRRMTKRRFVEMEHIQVAPRGRPGGVVDDRLAAEGLRRRVTRVVPYFLSALHLVAESDHVLTVPERVARATAPRFGLRVLEPPIPLAPYAIRQVWHPRNDAEPGHRWLRGALLDIAREC